MVVGKNLFDDNNFKVDINQLRDLFSEGNIYYRVVSPFHLWGRYRTLIPKGSVLEISTDGDKRIITSVYNHINKYIPGDRILNNHPEIFKKISI